MRRLLEAVERCRDSLAMIMLCRLVHGYLTRCKRNTSICRQRRLLRLDATTSLIKALRAFLRRTRPSRLRMIAVGAITAVLILLSPKDRHFCLKIRLGGLLSRFRYHLLCSFEFLSATLLQLICISIRSRMFFVFICKVLNFFILLFVFRTFRSLLI
uniref:Transmembrane protein n=1 Tax=Syphacia muris TaxID=451379 RepID=A0A0N5AU36_9BILA